MATRGSYVHNYMDFFFFLMQFSQNIDGFRRNDIDSQGF